MSVSVLDSAAWVEKLMGLPREGARQVTAFYEHRMGAICTDARCLLVPLDDHMVHRGDAIFPRETTTFSSTVGRVVCVKNRGSATNSASTTGFSSIFLGRIYLVSREMTVEIAVQPKTLMETDAIAE